MTNLTQFRSGAQAALLVLLGACATGPDDNIPTADVPTPPQEGARAADGDAAAGRLPPGHPPLEGLAPTDGAPATQANEATQPESLTGTVKETMNGGGYTYALADDPPHLLRISTRARGVPIAHRHG